jgi:hypothetical protein
VRLWRETNNGLTQRNAQSGCWISRALLSEVSCPQRARTQAVLPANGRTPSAFLTQRRFTAVRLAVRPCQYSPHTAKAFNHPPRRIRRAASSWCGVAGEWDGDSWRRLCRHSLALAGRLCLSISAGERPSPHAAHLRLLAPLGPARTRFLADFHVDFPRDQLALKKGRCHIILSIHSVYCEYPLNHPQHPDCSHSALRRRQRKARILSV